MNNVTISEIVEYIVDWWKSLCKIVLGIILFCTAPLWLIPYAIYNKLKYNVWF
jgi:hypothetical protein